MRHGPGPPKGPSRYLSYLATLCWQLAGIVVTNRLEGVQSRVSCPLSKGRMVFNMIPGKGVGMWHKDQFLEPQIKAHKVIQDLGIQPGTLES